MSSLRTITYLMFIKKLFTKHFFVLVHPNNSLSTYNVPDTVLHTVDFGSKYTVMWKSQTYKQAIIIRAMKAGREVQSTKGVSV